MSTARFLCLSVLVFSLALSAAPPDTSKWLRPRGREWHLTLESARDAAAREGKKIYVLFTGSDWCGWCVKLQKDVLRSSRFRKYAQKNLELLYVDFPSRKKNMPPEQRQYNTQLRSRLGGGGGVPSALLLDSKGNVIGKISGYRPLKQYMAALEKPAPAVSNRPQPRDAAAAPAVPAGWKTSLEEALAAAKKDGKKVMVLRTGSDWCPPCMKMEREALRSPRFKKFAKKHLELVFLDLPRRKAIMPAQRQYNNRIARELNMGGGVPSIAILDADGKVIGRTRGYRNLSRFMNFLEKTVK